MLGLYAVLFAVLLGCNDEKSNLPDSVRAEITNGRLDLEITRISDFCPKTIGDPSTVSSVSIRDRNFCNDDLLLLSAFCNLEILDLGNTQISSNSSEKISRFSKLKRLELHDTQIGDEFFAGLNLDSLHAIYASNCQLTPSSIRTISACRKLEILDVSRNPKIDDQVFRYLESTSELEKLYLQDTSVQGRGLEALFDSKIRVLCVAGTPLEESTTLAIAKLKTLQVLDLSRNLNINNLALAAFANHPGMYDLCLGRTGIDDDVFKVVARIPHLRRLHVFDCNISDEAVIENLTSISELSYIDVTGLDLSQATITKLRDVGIQVKY